MKLSFICMLLILASLLLAPVISVQAIEMVMVTPRAPDSPDGKWFKLIYTEAFKRLEWVFVYKHFPSKRCSFLSNKGKVAGEMERVKNYNSLFPNLIRVEEFLRTLSYIAYSNDPNIRLNSWEDLTNTEYQIDCRRGVKLCLDDLSRYIKHENLTFVNTTKSGLKRLLLKRSDIYTDFEIVINRILKTGEIDRSQLFFSGVLHQIKAHTFLHKKHKDRVPALAKVLKAMKKEGLLADYWKKANTEQ